MLRSVHSERLGRYVNLRVSPASLLEFQSSPESEGKTHAQALQEHHFSLTFIAQSNYLSGRAEECPERAARFDRVKTK